MSDTKGRESQPVQRLCWKVSEVADLIGASERFVWGEIARNKLKVSRIGVKTTRITAEDLEAYLAAGKVGAQ
jgi:excisionase family DNA binding protein